MRVSVTSDLESLLEPISENHPAGECLRYEGTYDRIQEARREDDPTLAQGVWQTQLKKADWRTVQDLCSEALATRSKDLQLVVWLLEAWLHLNGFAGVTTGVTLLRQLCEAFWPDLHPAIVADDLEARTSPMTWVNEKLSLKLKTIPLSRPHTGDALPYSWTDWESACRLENLGRKNARLLLDAEAEGRVTQATFMGSVMLTPLDFYVELVHEIQRAIDATTSLRQLLDSRCGRQAPSLVQYQQTLANIQHLIGTIVQQRGVEVPNEIISFDTENPETPQAPAAQPAARSSSGPIRSRDEAYQRLAEVADYLLKTEPHSPTPYLIKRAVSWGCMPLTELLREVVRDERDLGEIYTLLGVRQARETT